jgi:hypothetical protein
VLQKCCNQKKTPWKYWTQWTFTPLKNAKIPTKTHEMDVLEALEDETLESHSRSRGFESLRAHKKQAILLQNKARMPKITACCRNLKSLPRNWEAFFLFKSVRCCKSVAIRRDRTQWFTVEVGSSSLYAHTICKQNSLQNVPFFCTALSIN